MTTEPDAELECSLLKKTIKTRTDLDEDGLQQLVLDWIIARLEHEKTGFHFLGPGNESLCLEIQIQRDTNVMLRSKHEFAQILADKEIAEVQRTHFFVQKRIDDENLTPEVRQEKLTKVDKWLQNKIEGYKLETVRCWDDVQASGWELRQSLEKLIKAIRAEENEPVPKTHLIDDPDFQKELNDLLNNQEVVEEPRDDSILTKRTLILGEETATPDELMEQLPESSQNISGLDGVGDLPPILPDNQLGDSSIVSPSPATPVASAAVEEKSDPKNKRVLIVPPGHDVPIKQTKVNIFATAKGPLPDVPTVPESEEGNPVSEVKQDVPTPAESKEGDGLNKTDEGMRAASSEENAIKYIQQLDDGPTKQALMSLCEASLNKVGSHCFLDEEKIKHTRFQS